VQFRRLELPDFRSRSDEYAVGRMVSGKRAVRVLPADPAVHREANADILREGQIVDEDLPFQPGRREGKSAAGLRATPGHGAVQHHVPADSGEVGAEAVILPRI